VGLVPHWNVFTPWGFAGFVIFMVSALAESNRSPFDLPEAESELIAGHLTEYSGFKYALFFMAEYFGMCALSGMAVTLFLGGWQAPLPSLEFIPSYVWFAVKLLALLLGFIWIRATLPAPADRPAHPPGLEIPGAPRAREPRHGRLLVAHALGARSSLCAGPSPSPRRGPLPFLGRG
jgi:hypothetical protein